MGQSIISEKSFVFASDIIRFCKSLIDKREYVLSKQLMRSGTAVGALSREATNAESIRDFIHKLAIAQKECAETIYWLDLLQAIGYSPEKDHEQLRSSAEQLFKMITQAIVTSKQKLN